MKLLTHNMLSSKCLKGVKVGYPLGLKVSDQFYYCNSEYWNEWTLQVGEVAVTTVDFDSEYIQRIIPKLEWPVLKEAADEVLDSNYLPNELIENYSEDEEFLRKLHHVLMEVEIVEGTLVCPETGRCFPIKNGIPNMLLNDDEVWIYYVSEIVYMKNSCWNLLYRCKYFCIHFIDQNKNFMMNKL